MNDGKTEGFATKGVTRKRYEKQKKETSKYGRMAIGGCTAGIYSERNHWYTSSV
jgi:surface antigen